MGAQSDPMEAGRVLQRAASDPDARRAFEMAAALAEGLQQARSSLARPPYSELSVDLFKRASERASDASEREPIRAAAIKLLGFAEFARASEVLFARLRQPDSPVVQLAAVTALGRFNAPEAAAGLVSAWPSLTPRLREEALKVLLARTERIQTLLGAMETDVIRRDELSAAQIAGLREHREASITARAARIFGAVESERATVIAQFQQALTLKGQAAAGKRIFEERCSSCHRLGGIGSAVGPDMETVRDTGREKLLIAIADPNREVAPQFQSYEVEIRSGDILSGIIASETSSHLRLRQSFGKEEEVPRVNIVRIDSRGRSLMPDGLEAGLNLQEMADLLEYIETGR
jgi:putative heme-binding domain-containing protein